MIHKDTHLSPHKHTHTCRQKRVSVSFSLPRWCDFVIRGAACAQNEVWLELFTDKHHTQTKRPETNSCPGFFPPFSLPGLGALVPRPVGAPPPAAPTGGTHRYCYIQTPHGKKRNPSAARTVHTTTECVSIHWSLSLKLYIFMVCSEIIRLFNC